ncbi:hypothetical protein KEM48_006844 [Puccinia striiformis f. sp. tritici PST-130]|nr:hypothetical protein KEM48_006844 [Puccinia striiformis f. sp. tritici PST-130]
MSPNATDPHNPTKLPISDLPEVGHTVDYDDNPQSEGSRRRFAGNSNPAEGGGVVLRFKSYTRVFWAEFFGTAILALFGTAANNQVALSNSNAVSNAPAGTYLSVAFGWALAVMWASMYKSRDHASDGNFPWLSNLLAAQLTGSVTGAAHAIDLFEGGGGARTIEKTGDFFLPGFLTCLICLILDPLPYVSNANCFYNEFLMTAILMIFVVAVGDNGNAAPPKNMGPLVIFWVVFGLASTLGMQTSFSLNPARDLGPRLVTWFAGYGSHVWSIRSQPVCGAIVGAFIYDFFIATTQVTCALHGNNSQALPSFLSKIRPAKRNRPEQLSGLESGQA